MGRGGGSGGSGGGGRGFSGGGSRGFSGRSSFGGSRGSSSGFSGGGSRGVGGFSGGSFGGNSGGRRGSSFGGFGGFGLGGPGPADPNPFRGPRPGFGPMGAPPPPVYGYRTAARPMGCAGSVIGVLVVFAVIAVILVFTGFFSIFDGGSGGGDITVSTVARAALPAGSVNETGYYTDELGWLQNETKLLSGLKYFYQQTGVQPYIYITGDVGTGGIPAESDIEAFGNTQYDALFTDEAHLLLVFYENHGGYMTGVVTGVQAKTVIDSEAADILLDYLDRNYYSDMTEDEYFSRSFRDAADRIMTVTTSPWIPVLIVLGVLAALIVAFVWWRHAKKQKAAKAQRDKEILETPLDKFGDAEAENIAGKYDDDPNT